MSRRKKTTKAPDMEPYIETSHKVQPRTSERLDRLFTSKPGMRPAYAAIGNQRFVMTPDGWRRIKRRRNPAYWVQDICNGIYGPCAHPHVVILYKRPARITTGNWRRGLKRLARLVQGGAVPWRDILTLGTLEEKDWKAAIRRKDPVYRMHLDGSVERLGSVPENP